MKISAQVAMFLGAISIAAGVVSWWVAKTEDDEADRR
jgi:hypothetical protein